LKAITDTFDDVATHQVTVLEIHKLLDALILVDRVVISYNTFAVYSSLCRASGYSRCKLLNWARLCWTIHDG
jgi:hypothetical protein